MQAPSSIRTPDTPTTPLLACLFSAASGYQSISTNKELDPMTGNDIFLARYYSPYFGRFLSPDWSAKVTPVPYATFADPQSLNLYAYVRNNPLTRIDADGHDKINLNQDFDKLIKAAQTQLKDKSLSKVVQKELKDQIQGFKDANAAKGAV